MPLAATLNVAVVFQKFVRLAGCEVIEGLIAFVVTVNVADEEGFVSWVLGFGTDAVVRSPARVREAVVKRLKDSAYLAGQGNVERLERAALRYRGRAYDPYFEWSDERIYCSELVWKAYEHGLGLRIGEPAALSTFDLSSDVVKRKLRERYGDRVPLQEQVISPAAIFDSPLLMSVP